jgi:hypothetical protein
MDTFMTELSSVMRNWVDAKTTRTKPDPERLPDVLTAGSLGERPIVVNPKCSPGACSD